MSEIADPVYNQLATVSAPDVEPTDSPRVPQYRRDLVPTNVVLSADDLREFCELLTDINGRAKTIEFNNFDASQFESPKQARARIDELMPIEYSYRAKSGDSVQGLGLPKTDERSFPEDLDSFFVSNASYAERAVKATPLNTVAVFFGFDRPSLKIDLETIPSNRTVNRSIINVSGRDEDWVISATEKIQSFLRKKRTFRPVLHGSGTYDYFIYLTFLPSILWLFHKKGSWVTQWLQEQSVFMNVMLAIYALLMSLLFGRFLFQYFRWLFPPMEYYKKSRIGAYLHRSVAGLVGSALLLGAAYDLVKLAFLSVFGNA